MEWLSERNLRITIAGRRLANETEADARADYAELFRSRGLTVEASDPAALVLFPEMEGDRAVPEITEACWGILGRAPEQMMCATSRMVVRRKGAAEATIVA